MKILLLLSISCCVAFAGCSAGSGNTNSASNSAPVTTNQAANTASSNSASTYPQTTVDAFLESCQEAGSDESFCSCVFAKVQAKYSFEEFSVIESKIVAGTPPEEFVEFTGKARAECTKK